MATPAPTSWGWSLCDPWLEWLLGFVRLVDGASLFEAMLAVMLLTRLGESLVGFIRWALPVDELMKTIMVLLDEASTFDKRKVPALGEASRVLTLAKITDLFRRSFFPGLAVVFGLNILVSALDPDFGVQRWWFLLMAVLPVLYLALGCLVLIALQKWLAARIERKTGKGHIQVASAQQPQSPPRTQAQMGALEDELSDVLDTLSKPSSGKGAGI